MDLDSVAGDSQLLGAVRTYVITVSQAVASIGTNRTPERFITE
jgi:hypothetical protein